MLDFLKYYLTGIVLLSVYSFIHIREVIKGLGGLRLFVSLVLCSVVWPYSIVRIMQIGKNK